MRTVELVAYPVFAAIVGGLALRFIPVGKQRVTPDAVSIARDALLKADWIFQQSTSYGGKLQHPWKTTSGEINYHDLEGLLIDAHNRIKSRRFRKLILVVISELKGVYASSFLGRPGVYFEGLETSREESVWETSSKKLAIVQLGHATAGVNALKNVQEVFAKLSSGS